LEKEAVLSLAEMRHCCWIFSGRS